MEFGLEMEENLEFLVIATVALPGSQP